MSAPHRAVVFVYSSVGCICLRALLERGVEVAAVYTHEGEKVDKRSIVGEEDAARGLAQAQRLPAEVRRQPLILLAQNC